MRDKEILRAAIIGELDAINLCEQTAALADPHLKAVLLDIAKEEKAHVDEFQTLLLLADRVQVTELADGKKEVEELIAKAKQSK